MPHWPRGVGILLARHARALPPNRALIADTDRFTRFSLSNHLLMEGFVVKECSEGLEALDCATASHFDLILLDASLPNFSEAALCNMMRRQSSNPGVAIFVIATSAAESDKVLAFANGADDYLVKPVSIREFLARVSAAVRRAERATAARASETMEFGDLRIDSARRQVSIRGYTIPCSKQEFALLHALAASPGIVLTREELLQRCWPKASHSDVRLVDPIVSRVRRKMESNHGSPRWILTVWGVGYKFAEPLRDSHS